MLDGILDDILTVSPAVGGEIRPDSPAFAHAEIQEWRGFSPLSPLSPGSSGEIVSPSDMTTAPGDDRRYCRQCLNLNSNGYCTAERFRPTDDMPRRCDKFKSNGKPAFLSWLEERDIREWLAMIGETDAALVEEIIERCRMDMAARWHFLKRADEITEPTTPKAAANHTCQECRHWQRDTIGDGAGLGACSIDAPRRGLPWPNQTACNQFEVNP